MPKYPNLSNQNFYIFLASVMNTMHMSAYYPDNIWCFASVLLWGICVLKFEVFYRLLVTLDMELFCKLKKLCVSI